MTGDEYCFSMINRIPVFSSPTIDSFMNDLDRLDRVLLDRAMAMPFTI